MAKNVKSSDQSLLKLPQRSETWLLTVRKLAGWLEDNNGELVRPYLSLLANQDLDLVLDFMIDFDKPDAEAVGGLLWRAMQKPKRDLRQTPHRPKEVLCDHERLVGELVLHLAEVGIAASYEANLELMDELVEVLENEVGEKNDRPGLLSIAGCTPELVGALFAAAAETYIAEPWLYLSTEQPIKYSLPDLGKDGYVQIMGNSAIEYGLLLYDRWQDLELMYINTGSAQPALPEAGLTSFSYATPDLLSTADLDAAGRYGWPVADADAYPLPMIMLADSAGLPDLPTLQVITAMLGVLPQFTQRLEPDLQGDYLPFKMETEAPIGAGGLAIRLEYPAGKLRHEAFPASENYFDEDESDEEFTDYEDEEDDALLVDIDEEEDENIADWQASPIAECNPALIQAMGLVYAAWDELNPAVRVDMARQALELSPDCAEAYILLAEDLAVNIGQALKFYQKGVDAGERTLGVDFFSQFMGEFWQHIEARPYLRARSHLANTLWEIERRVEALEHLEELRRLDREDHNATHYATLMILLEMDRWDDAYLFSCQFDDPSAFWLYSKALLAFRRSGDTPEAKEILHLALKANQFCPAYLIERKRLPANENLYPEPGSKDEAIIYVTENISYWRQTPGAVDWLRRISRAGETSHPVHQKAKKHKRR